jgi:SAM-dependent methyltransferase
MINKLLSMPLLLPLRSLYRGARAHFEFVVQDLCDRLFGRAKRHAPFKLPPARLRYQVHVAVDPGSFVRTANMDAGLIVNALKTQNRTLPDCAAILDWGCGPGKVLQALYLNYLQAVAPSLRPNLYGCDISNEAIRWASRHLPFASFHVNNSLPPLPFYPRQFDLVYGISVFSHLDKNFETAWLLELNRIIKPEGLIIVSLRGAHASSLAIKPGSEEEQRLRSEGIIFRPPTVGFRKEGLPDCYGNTYHTPDYVRKKYGQQFQILAHMERGLLGGQDLLILQPKTASGSVCAAG